MGKPLKDASQGAMGEAGHAAGELPGWALHVDDHGHGAGDYTPSGADLAVVALAWVILIISLMMTFKYLFRPGETGSDHIKRRILCDGGPQ